MRIAALDLGDVWVGIALSDPLHMLARPYKTVTLSKLTETLTALIAQEQVTEIVVGDPQTLRGTVSEQTLRVREQLAELEKEFPTITWNTWDERMTSKQASTIQKGGSKEEKQRQHSVAAALILRSYLDRLAWKKNSEIPLD